MNDTHENLNEGRNGGSPGMACSDSWREIYLVFIAAVCSACLGFVAGREIKPKSECPHKWGAWKETDRRTDLSGGIIQKRSCGKCGWTDENS